MDKKSSDWKRFCTSGTIDDYLKFVSESKEDGAAVQNTNNQKHKELRSAGFYNNDRDGY